MRVLRDETGITTARRRLVCPFKGRRSIAWPTAGATGKSGGASPWVVACVGGAMVDHASFKRRVEAHIRPKKRVVS